MAINIRRREFILTLGGAVTAWPLAARSQQPAMPVIGLLGSGSAQGYAVQAAAFRLGLQEAGYREGESVAIEYRWAEDHYERLTALAAELVHSQVAVIAAIGGLPAALAAKEATTTTPIVFMTGADPVAVGLVASLSRPGGNVTGVSGLNVEVGPKQLELLLELVPTASVFAVLINPSSPLAETLLQTLRAAARTLGRQLHVVQASTERDFDPVFASLAQLRAGGLVITPDAFFFGHSEQLAVLALRHAVPAIYQYREFTAAGGLMSYGASLTDMYRLAGVYTGRILKGEKPANLPVQQSTKVELFINLKTAKAFGITFPITLLGRADEVIE
jgi:putative ABC transport system substrate-binding protein